MGDLVGECRLTRSASGDASQAVEEAFDGLKLTPESQKWMLKLGSAFAMASENGQALCSHRHQRFTFLSSL
jgi:hypothetical protein